MTSLRQLAGELSAEISMLSQVIGDLLAGDRGYHVIGQLPGIGPVLAAVIVAEIGGVTRFGSAAQLCSWAGLTPRHREPRHQGHPRPCHQARVPAAALGADRGRRHVPAGSLPGTVRQTIIARRGRQARNIAKVAAARRLLTLVYYGMRDGQLRCLAKPSGDAPPAPRQAA